MPTYEAIVHVTARYEVKVEAGNKGEAIRMIEEHEVEPGNFDVPQYDDDYTVTDIREVKDAKSRKKNSSKTKL